MSRAPKPPTFLQRASYRQRRLRDAAKLAPFLGMILWAIPLAWPKDESVVSDALIYVFGVWVILIVLTAALASRIRADNPSVSDDAIEK